MEGWMGEWMSGWVDAWQHGVRHKRVRQRKGATQEAWEGKGVRPQQAWDAMPLYCLDHGRLELNRLFYLTKH